MSIYRTKLELDAESKVDEIPEETLTERFFRALPYQSYYEMLRIRLSNLLSRTGRENATILRNLISALGVGYETPFRQAGLALVPLLEFAEKYPNKTWNFSEFPE